MNLRKNLLIFVEYVLKNEVKRSYRSNEIPSSDIKKITKAFTFVENRALDYQEYIEFISQLTLKMGLVSYDTQGQYAGHTSRELSYPDNYIIVNLEKYKHYLKLSSADKEYAILNSLTHQTPNEFYESSILGTQERFSQSGRAINGASKMNLFEIRQKLFQILVTFPVDVPVSFDAFVDKVKEIAPDLIVPRSKSHSKYFCFSEFVFDSPKTLEETCSFFYLEGKKREVNEADIDAFHRVEGRYLAYFLETIPMLMDWIRLEYDDLFKEKVHSCDPPLPTFIKSFTILKKMQAMLAKEYSYLNYVKTTVTPDFKIFIESSLSPDQEFLTLEPYAEVVSENKHVITMELSRKKTVYSLATIPGLALPQDLFEQMNLVLPKNVITEIQSWTAEADKFIVYENADLVEVDPKEAGLKEKIIQDCGAHFLDAQNEVYLIARRQNDIYQHLENSLFIPTCVDHLADSLFVDQLKYALSQTTAPVTPLALKAEKVKISQKEFIGISVKNMKFLNQLLESFKALKIVSIVPEGMGMCFIPKAEQYQIKNVIEKLNAQYQVDFVVN